jgi:beta-N-acetylhexosaminidase
LRNYLGFRGVVTTDCMEMKAIKNTIGTAKGSVAAINAGVDMVMISHTFELQKETAELLVQSVLDGGIGEEMISGASERIQKLKERYLSWDNFTGNSQNAGKDALPEMIGGTRHRSLARDIYRQGITLYKNDGDMIPISADNGQKILVIYPKGNNIVQVEDIQYSSCLLGNAVKEIFPAAEVLEFSDNPAAEEIASILDKSVEYDTIIAGTMSATHDPGQSRLVNGLLSRKKNVIIVAMKSPYDFACFPNARAYVATYEHTYPALVAAARVIFGLDGPLGKMPVTIE